jgi:hypothetical protein
LVHADGSYWVLYRKNVKQVLCKARYLFYKFLLSKAFEIVTG